MAWVYLFIAGILEIGWAIGIKYTEGRTREVPGIFSAVSMVAGFWFLSLAIRHLLIGRAYAVWTGIGTTGTAVPGMILFRKVLICCVSTAGFSLWPGCRPETVIFSIVNSY